MSGRPSKWTSLHKRQHSGITQHVIYSMLELVPQGFKHFPQFTLRKYILHMALCISRHYRLQPKRISYDTLTLEQRHIPMACHGGFL